RELIALLVDIGYNGAISSEYEGWHWNYWESPFDIIRGEQAVQRSAAEAVGSHMVVDAAAARIQLAAHLGHGAPSA
ncbi:MAG TPA: sugar phosphate isomerase/epimerase, partial [Pseudolysinimonas sp.]